MEVRKWAIVDPQNPAGDALNVVDADSWKRGWMQYSSAYQEIESFAREVCQQMPVGDGHGPINLAEGKAAHARLAEFAYGTNDRLGGKESLFAWLGCMLSK